jgi:hypothetical protein
MPVAMTRQLARLTSDAFVKDVFRRCVDMRADRLSNKRLLLRDDQGDPIASACCGGGVGTTPVCFPYVGWGVGYGSLGVEY